MLSLAGIVSVKSNSWEKSKRMLSLAGIASVKSKILGKNPNECYPLPG